MLGQILGSGRPVVYLLPAEVILPGPHFKMVFDDAQVDIRITGHGKQGFGFHLVAVMQNEFEFLLVNGRRSQHGSYHS